MGRHELARVVDRDALDDADGPRARLQIRVPVSWLRAQREVDVQVPEVLACARCAGGGCDACGRSGAVRAHLPASERQLRVQLPHCAEGAVLRLAPPWPEGSIEQLLLEVRPGEPVSDHVRVVPTSAEPSAQLRTLRGNVAFLLVVAAAAALVAALLWQW